MTIIQIGTELKRKSMCSLFLPKKNMCLLIFFIFFCIFVCFTRNRKKKTKRPKKKTQKHNRNELKLVKPFKKENKKDAIIPWDEIKQEMFHLGSTLCGNAHKKGKLCDVPTSGVITITRR